MQRPAYGVLAIGALLGLLAGGGCQPKPAVVSLGPLARRAQPPAYGRILARWTRHQVITIVEELSTTARIYATLLSPEFNAAYAAKRRALFRLTAPEMEALRTELAEQWDSSYPFVVALATHNLHWNDLHRLDSHWRLHLRNDHGDTVSPLLIAHQRRITHTDTELFPFVEHFYRLYSVRFPKTLPDGRPLVEERTRRLILSISGAQGQTELVWRLRP